jgi:hypothetical protein
MKQPSPPTLERDHNDHSLALVDRLDPAIGEASSVMGAVLTELLRRSLRGGVLQIGDELQSFVIDKVDITLAERTPAIEQAAAEVAGNTARSVAAQVAGLEVENLERWTKETTQELASQMVEAERRTQHTTAETARTFASQIEETKKEAQQATTDTAQKLAGQIEEARQRAEEAAQAQMTQQVQDLLQRSRKNSAVWKSRFRVLETTAGTLAEQLAAEQNERRTEFTATKAELQQRTTKLLQRLEQEQKDRRAAEDGLRQEFVRRMEEKIEQLQQANEALSARVVELEKPRGIGAAFAKLFGRRKEQTPEADTSA